MGVQRAEAFVTVLGKFTNLSPVVIRKPEKLFIFMGMAKGISKEDVARSY